MVSNRTYLSIGDVLTLLREEFPDVTISKIRFLESQGLVNPERSPSGYRKFYDHDVERLRWVLRQQREHFLPLKVIRDRLASEDGTQDAPARSETVAALETRANGALEAAAPAPERAVAAPRPRTSVPGGTPQTVGRPGGLGLVTGGRAPGPSPAAPADLGPSEDVPSELTPVAAPADRGSVRREAAPPPAARPLLTPAGGDGAAQPAAAQTATAPPPAVTAGQPGPGHASTTGASTPAGPSVPPAAEPFRVAQMGDDPAPSDEGPPARGDGPAAAPAPRSRPAALGPEPGTREPAPQAPPGRAAAPKGSSPRSGPSRPQTGGQAPPGPPPARSPGRAPPAGPGFAPAAGVSGVSLTAEELSGASGLSETELAALEGYGLVEPMVVAGVLFYDEEALTVAKLAAQFGRYGIEPRHLRLYRNAVEREVGLIEQIITPLLRQRNPESRQRAVDSATDLAALGQSLRASLLRKELHGQFGG